MKDSVKNLSWIRLIPLELIPPSLKDNTADGDRLVKALKKTLSAESISIDFGLLNAIPRLLRDHDYTIQAVVYQTDQSWHLIDLLPPARKKIYGLAVDLGTSTIVMRLVCLNDGQSMDEVSFLNPQIEIGPDILTRIHFCSRKDGLKRLQKGVITGLNNCLRNLLSKYQLDEKVVLGMTVAGNTTMSHLFMGLDPYWLCREPYIPVVNRPDPISALDLGLDINPRAPVMVFPNSGSYLGGDLIAGILASGLNHSEEVCLLVDVGTNAEVILGNRDWLMACAGAAGPALEGGVAKMGMMASPGVIDKVVFDRESDDFYCRTINDKPAVGICGSGMIDLAAQLFLSGFIDMRGKFVVDRCGDRLTNVDGIVHFVLVRADASGTGQDLTLSQPDLDSLLRSKAAMHTILVTITKMINLSMNDIHRFYVAGTFGSFIDPQSAITIGMIPDLPLEIFVPLGNTSLAGATRVLLSSEDHKEIYRLRDRITYVELNVNQEFMNRFSASKFIPHTDIDRFPSVKKRLEMK
jgi:uncharacterized 2Fe-2S/4Fe-4S cluster protein (DUF4445 family)